MEDLPLAGAGDSRFTMRLRLEPAGPANAGDLWLVHGDDGVWPWYGTGKPGPGQAERQAKSMGGSWRLHGVCKWIGYDRVSGEVVGRGGLSRTPAAGDWGQICAFLPAQPWVRAAHAGRRPFIAHANWDSFRADIARKDTQSAKRQTVSMILGHRWADSAAAF